jgi:hypothetical protein
MSRVLGSRVWWDVECGKWELTREIDTRDWKGKGKKGKGIKGKE